MNFEDIEDKMTTNIQLQNNIDLYTEHNKTELQTNNETNTETNTETNNEINARINSNETEGFIDASADAMSVDVFNVALHQYLRVDEEIKKLMMAIKERNEIKRKLNTTLSGFLKAKQIKKVDLDGSYKGKRLEVEVKTSKSSFTREKVAEALYNELQEEQVLFDRVMTAISKKDDIIKQMYKIKIIDDKEKTKKQSTKYNRKTNPNGLSEIENIINSD